MQPRLPIKELALQRGQFSGFPKLTENVILPLIETNTCFRTLCELDTLVI